MRRRHFIALAGIAPLAGCGWFRREEDEVEVATDPRPLVAQVTQLAVEPHPSGVIVRATGLPPRQGYYDGELVRVVSDDPAVLSYQFRAYAPHYRTAVVNTRSREIVVGKFINRRVLPGVREIRVAGQYNALTARP